MDDHEKAKAWREKRELSVEELSALVGFSIESIYQFEKGFAYAGRTDKNNIKRKKLDERAWQRYRMACAGVQADLKNGRKFNW